MMWYGHVFRYKSSSKWSLSIDDPVVEFLSQGLVGGPLKGVKKDFRINEYFAFSFVFNGSSVIPYPVLGVASSGRGIPKLHIVAFYCWLFCNPFTIAGDCSLAIIVYRDFLPGPGVFPTSEYALILREPDRSVKVCDVLYPGVAAVGVKCTRRGIDLLASLAKSTLGLQLFLNNPCNNPYVELFEGTLLSILEAILAKSLQNEFRGIDVVASYTTAYRIPIDLIQTARRYMRVFKEHAEDINYLLRQLLSDRDLLDYVLGELVLLTGMSSSTYASFVEQLQGRLNQLVNKLTGFVKGNLAIEAVVADITGKWSLLDLYVTSQLAKRIGAQQIYLLVTPESHINLVSVYLLIIDAKNHNIDVKINIDNNLMLEIEGVKIIPIASSATDPHIVKAVVSHIVRKHNKRIVHLIAHPALASAVTLRLYYEERILDKCVLTYPLSQYMYM